MSNSDFGHLDALDEELSKLQRGTHGYAAGLHRIASLMQELAEKTAEDAVPVVRKNDAHEASFRAWEESERLGGDAANKDHDGAVRLHDDIAYQAKHGHTRLEEIGDGVVS